MNVQAGGLPIKFTILVLLASLVLNCEGEFVIKSV